SPTPPAMSEDSSTPQPRRRRIGCNADVCNADVCNETLAKKVLTSGSFAGLSCLTATQSTSFVRAPNAEHRRPLGARRNQGANRRPGTARTYISSSCGFHWVAAERDIRLKVGRYRL